MVGFFKLSGLRATYMDLYTIGYTVEPPIAWYFHKCMFIEGNCLYFSFVTTNLRKRCSRAGTIFNLRDIFTYYCGINRDLVNVYKN